MKDVKLSREIYDHALQCGFDNCGIIPIDALNGFGELYGKRISDVPQSKFFYENVGDLNGTKERFPWARSIVILTFNYGKYRYPKELRGRYAKAFFLEPAQNAVFGFDLQRLEKWFVEHNIRAEGGNDLGHISVGPLRYIAMKAGLGIIRKNNFFYTKTGSYNTLVGYVIDKECELIQNADLIPCGEKCDLCRRACKTKALQSEYTIDPLKCVSYWTTFGNSDIPQGLCSEMFEEWVCGCDNCQDACPHNLKHNWDIGDGLSNLDEIAPLLLPCNYDDLSDQFLIEQVIPKTADHLQSKDVEALRKNAARALDYQNNKSDDQTPYS